MFAPILCLSLFAVSAWASVELHGVLELPRADQSLTESRRFKRQIGFDRATQCIMSCYQDFMSTIQSLGMDQSAVLNQFYDPNTFKAFCGRVDQWTSCAGACSSSQANTRLIKALQSFVSLCGEDRETFESHQTCYRESEPQQNQVCDPKCGGHKEVQEEINKLPLVATDILATASILKKICQMDSCQIKCRIPIIHAACEDKEAALFFERWNYKSMKQAMAALGLGNINCGDVINSDLDEFYLDEDGVKLSWGGVPKDREASSPGPQKSGIFPGESVLKNNLAPQTTRNNILLLIALSMVFAGFLL